ncbi:MAG: hypothetical protein RRZ85_05280, partial [Gordonibacter sp.]|uniref:hypothetical protein n=1 Tax=Gordonibacter sp. TaxID=1968902 RepID=UPI002FC9A2F9
TMQTMQTMLRGFHTKKQILITPMQILNNLTPKMLFVAQVMSVSYQHWHLPYTAISLDTRAYRKYAE